ncbi:splicing factor Cactin [Episyrphus balteatus]|uniref:splicing factor Cactin n=1 Tax=Episyrphus balteatus TaxID=286459 RepID=UPI0024852060|nr:splicing factor Cactin [Episyrphus balteatus]
MDSANEIKLLKRLETKRLNEILERKRLKEELKSKETPSEKRARRLQEKKAKEARRRERMGWDTEYQHYTNQDNPFGDAHLTSTFVWGKKLEKEGFKNVAPETVEVMHRQKQVENKKELEKVKKRRQKREMERLSREEEMNMLQRSREATKFEEWEKQEDMFHLKQARLRSSIRIRDGRAKPIDLLAQYISNSNLEQNIEMQMHEPYTFLNGLDIQDLEDLLVDIEVYIDLEKGTNSEFWNDMTVIANDELQKLRKLELGCEYDAKIGRREGIHQSVSKEVSDVFRGKTAQQLEELRHKIETKIMRKTDGVDISYWESLLSKLKAHMARARLRDRHQLKLRQKLELLKNSTVEDSKSTITLENSLKEEVEGMTSPDLDHEHDSNVVANEEEVEENDNDESHSNMCYDLYNDGCYSPPYLKPDEIEGFKLITSEEAEDRIETLRKTLIESIYEDSSMSREDLLLQQEARKGMTDDEAVFSVETKLESQVYLWSDKYRPRKPRYFNRVHTGFEWNKYNQTHYDMDNPPPKIVQGYKFNIFYPDLINQSCTPQYFLTPCADNVDFAVLRFHAGPPYEDIAFKIVNREWEFSYKRGFRCQFQNNIFQLWFHFKRYRYRR